MKTVKQLVEQLNTMPQDAIVCIFDVNKNIHYADADPTSVGIITDFKVEYHKEEDVSRPFVGLVFENDDYNQD